MIKTPPIFEDMTPKQYLNKVLDRFINRITPWDSTKVEVFRRDVEEPLRKRFRECNTNEELLQYARDLDEYIANSYYVQDKMNYDLQDNLYESLMCQKFGWEFKGKYNTAINLYFTKEKSMRMWNHVDTLDWNSETKNFIIDGDEQEIKLGYYSITFIDKIIFINSDKDAYKAVEHFKQIKEKIKLQEIKNDF